MQNIIPPDGGPTRFLILDRAPAAPRLIIASAIIPSDQRPITLDRAGRYVGWEEDIVPWVRAQVGHDVELTPIHDGLAWSVTAPRLGDAWLYR
jgi:hypothetical protein